MVTKQEIKKLENSTVRLTITIGKKSLKKEYDETLNKYCKTASMKGFRQGKVPRSILESKYGESLQGEVSYKVMEDSLKEAIDKVEEKPLGYDLPRLENEEKLTFDVNKDLTFSVIYDTFPEINLSEYTKLTIEGPTTTIGKKELDGELNKIQEQNSVIVEKAKGAVENDNIVTIDFCELDEKDTEIADTKRDDYVFGVGSGFNKYKIDEDIIGMKKDEEKVLSKKYDKDFEDKSLAEKVIKLKVKIKVIKEKKLPEIDDELAQDVSEDYKTLDDMKSAIKKRLKSTSDEKIRGLNVNAILDNILESTPMVLPESMIKAELENSWKRFVMESGVPEEQVLTFIKMQGKTKETVLEEWKESTTVSLKHRLIMDKIKEAEKFEVTDKEIEDDIKKQAEMAKMDFKDAKEHFEKNNLTEYLKDGIKDKKLFDFLLENNKINKGKKVNYLDLINENN